MKSPDRGTPAPGNDIDYAAVEKAVADNGLWRELESVNEERAGVEAEYRGVLKTMQEPVLIEPEEQEGHVARLSEMLGKIREVRARQKATVAKLNEASAERAKEKK